MRHIGIDEGEGDVAVEERYIRPTAGYPQGSYLRIVGGNIEIATGRYEKQFPGHPSPYFHGGPTFVLYEHFEVPWEQKSPDGGGPFDKAVDRIIAHVDKHLGVPET